MAQFYTLEEAARVLGMSSDELKSKAQAREVRAFLDGGSWRFRVVDVDELARRRGLGSDAELRLSDLEVPAMTGDEGGDLDLSEFQLGVAKPDLGSETMHHGKLSAVSPEGSSEHDILLDDLSLPPNPITGSSSVIIGVSTSAGKHPSDSDVRLVPDNVKGASDSDVRLATPEPDFRQPSDSDVTLVKDDTADHGVLTPSSGSDTSVRTTPPLLGSSAEVPASQSDSDFDLNPSSELIDALQPDSGSDFELTALDASDEFEATPLKASDSDVTAADPNISGINLSRPSDSGINLQAAVGTGPGPGRFDRAGTALAMRRSRRPEAKAKPSAQEVAGQDAPAARSRRARRTSSTTPTSRWTSPSPTTTPTTRPCSSRPPATSSSRRATAPPRSSPSTRRPWTRTPRPPWHHRRSPRTRTRRTTGSTRRSPARWAARGPRPSQPAAAAERSGPAVVLTRG